MKTIGQEERELQEERQKLEIQQMNDVMQLIKITVILGIISFAVSVFDLSIVFSKHKTGFDFIAGIFIGVLFAVSGIVCISVAIKRSKQLKK